MQPYGPGQSFKGLGVAKRYCRIDLIGDTFVQDIVTLTGSEGQSHYVELSDDVSIPRYLGYLCLRCVNLTMPFERTLRDNEIKVVEERRYRLVSAKDLYNGAIHNYGRRDIAVVKIWHRAREEIMVFLGRFSQSWSDSLMSMGEPL